MSDEQQCVFCHIASGKIPAKKVYEDDKVTAVLDINPGTSGHVLVIPKQHAAIMPQMSDDLIAHLGMVSKQLSQAVIRALKVEGTSIFVANGVAAGQRAPHFLLHVIPRKVDDEVALQPGIVKVDQKTAEAVFEKLSAAVAKQFGKEPPKPRVEKKEEKKETHKEEPKQEQPVEKPSKSKLDDITNFLAGGK